ncbi:MAG: FAD:protein FMN transferase [Anaerolineae bacterium]
MPTYSIQFKAMGCHMQAWAAADSPDDARVLEEVPAWFEAWEACLSRFRPTSELSRLNAHAGSWMPVSPLLFDLITDSVEAAEQTNGLFNPLILNALEAVGYAESFSPSVMTQPSGSARMMDAPVPSWESIRLDLMRGMVCLPAGSRIDLGGIAKGWAAQEAADRLFERGSAHAGFHGCMIDAGGDIAAHGSPDESDGWIVSLERGDDDEPVDILLIDESAATSGTDYRRWQRGDQPMHHLIDPRTGQPSQSSVLRASVIAPDASQAVVWAKVSLMTEQFSDYPTLFVYTDGTSASNWEA